MELTLPIRRQTARPIPAELVENLPRTPHPGSFRKGHDLRRHKFTRVECSEGFWAGLASYVEQGGEARNFLRGKMMAREQPFRHTPKAERGRIAA